MTRPRRGFVVGMFDYVQCDYPLPGGYVTDYGFQTDDHHCDLNHLRITAEGTLMCRKFSDVNASVAELWGEPLSDDDLLLEELDSDYHGDMVIYDGVKNFVARFWRGKLRFIEEVSEKVECEPRSFLDYLGTRGMG